MSNFEPRELQCVECGRTFDFSVEDQEYYAEKGYSEPKRCPECRQARKARKGNGGHRAPRQLYTAVCSDCGCETQVPFQPTGERPVYCPDCYKNHR